MREFCKIGGVIEASPPRLPKDCGAVSVSFNIEPDGKTSLIGSYNKIEAGKYKTGAYQFPQTHLPNLNM